MRIHDELIMVRLPPDDESAAPLKFVWRTRLWQVLSVQRSWVEAGAWWDDPRVRRARGQDVTRWSSELGAPAAAQVSEVRNDDLLGDRRIWRVEASAGASGAVGVYELSCRGPDWRLRAVID